MLLCFLNKEVQVETLMNISCQNRHNYHILQTPMLIFYIFVHLPKSERILHILQGALIRRWQQSSPLELSVKKIHKKYAHYVIICQFWLTES